MNEGKISVRYARALYNLAKEEKLHELVRKDMEVIMELLSSVAEFKILTDNPIIKPSRKIKILKTVFDDKFQKITQSLIELIVKNNRINYLGAIARIYVDIYKKNMGIQSAILVAPVPVEEDIRHSIIKTIEKKWNIKIELEEIINENLIGGFVLRIGTHQIDASISHQLEKIKKELINS